MTRPDTAPPVHASGTFTFRRSGADALTVHRLGYGAMQLTGRGVWGPPADREEARRVLRRAVELGVDFIDTADSYGPTVSEEIIREALYPYPDGLVIATKAGLVRTGPGEWHPVGRPEYLRQQAELSLRRLGVEAIDLFQLHRVDPAVPADDQFGTLAELQKEGKIRYAGLSEVGVEEVRAARRIVDVVSVQNLFNLLERRSTDVLDYCAAEGVAFIPWFPIANGDLAGPGGPVARVCEETGARPAQVALAWLLARSPVMVPIPGTSSVGHLEENCAAAALSLSDEQRRLLDDAAS